MPVGRRVLEGITSTIHDDPLPDVYSAHKVNVYTCTPTQATDSYEIDMPQAKFQSQSQSNPKEKGNLVSGLSLKSC